jgi:DNA-binding SARP family transcriptional activator
MQARGELERLRQHARMELARDRANGHGRSQPEALVDAWENCLRQDPASEEAAAALMTIYAARGQRQLVARVYRRCHDGLKELGLKPSAAVERALQRATEDAGPWAYAMPG